MAEITMVAVVGAGTMGSQIALQTAYAGRYEVALVDSSAEQLERARAQNEQLVRRGAGGEGRGERKRALTGQASSRWAGAITKTSNDQWERGWRNLRDEHVAVEEQFYDYTTR